jgi:hypothetical protein
MKYSTASSNAPLAGNGFAQEIVSETKNPYSQLDDLMVVLEALCPEWPKRDTFPVGDKMLL